MPGKQLDNPKEKLHVIVLRQGVKLHHPFVTNKHIMYTFARIGNNKIFTTETCNQWDASRIKVRIEKVNFPQKRRNIREQAISEDSELIQLLAYWGRKINFLKFSLCLFPCARVAVDVGWLRGFITRALLNKPKQILHHFL